MKSLILVFLCVLISSCVEQTTSYGNAAFNAEYELAITKFAEENNAIPKFESFPVQEIYNGKAKDFIPKNAFERFNEQKLRNYATKSPIFAGEYVAVTWICGKNCINTVLINKRTGTALAVTESFGGAGGERIVAMRPDSRLMVTRVPLLSSTEDYLEIGYMYKVRILDGDELTEIKAYPKAQPSFNSTDR